MEVRQTKTKFLGEELTDLFNSASKNIGQIVDMVLFNDEIIEDLKYEANLGKEAYVKYYYDKRLRPLKSIDNKVLVNYIRNTYGVGVTVNFESNVVRYSWYSKSDRIEVSQC